MRRWGAWLLILCCSFWVNSPVRGQVAHRLRDGTLLIGKSTELDTIGAKAKKVRTNQAGDPLPRHLFVKLVEEGEAVRFFTSIHHVVEQVDSVESLQAVERFKVPQTVQGRGQIIAQVGTPLEITGFNEFGRRRVTFRQEFPGTKRPPQEVHVIQGITEITPKYVHISGLTHVWEFGLPTSAIPREVLDQQIRRSINSQNPDDRFAVARFYTQAEMFLEANRELDAISRDFPQLLEAVKTAGLELRQLMARIAVTQIKARRDAGQYQLAAQLAQQFPVQDISGAILKEVRDIQLLCEKEQQQLEQLRDQLGQLQAQLPKKQAEQVAPLRSLLLEDLHPATLSRLSAYQTLATAENLAPDQKLALALSGWIVGPDLAVTRLEGALALWEARFIAREYLLAVSPDEREEKYQELRALEGVGPEQLERLLKQLPPLIETPDLQPQVPLPLEVPGVTDDEIPVRYLAVLPPEYHPGREYPVVIALHPATRNLEETAEWWAGVPQNPGPAARYGVIVLIPEYADEGQRSYRLNVAAHRAVRVALRDACKRFSIATDRVTLAGHGMGADAAFDIGLQFPDLFAGVLAISGECANELRPVLGNGHDLPMLVLNGELDRDVLSANADKLDQMMKDHQPVLYAEFIGRGYEDYRSEAPRMFEWMLRQRRTLVPKEFEIKTLTNEPAHRWWWNFWNFPTVGRPTSVRSDRERPPQLLQSSARLAPGANLLQLTSPAKQHRIWLSPQLVSFQERLEIRCNSQRKYNAIPEPDLRAMLEDFRLRGDRQQIAWAMVEF